MHNRLFSFGSGRIVKYGIVRALIIQLEILQVSSNKTTLCKHPYEA